MFSDASGLADPKNRWPQSRQRYGARSKTIAKDPASWNCDRRSGLAGMAAWVAPHSLSRGVRGCCLALLLIADQMATAIAADTRESSATAWTLPSFALIAKDFAGCLSLAIDF
jgi:hypothetical protein